MEVETRPAHLPGTFWKAVFSDLESTGILRGLSPDTPDRAGTFNSQLQIPLALGEK
jgi:hypothetical protein